MLRSRTAAIGLALVLVGCASASQQVETQPIDIPAANSVVSTAPARLTVGKGRVLVLSPVSLEQVSANLTAETATGGVGGVTAAGVEQTTSYNVAVSETERALLEGGWQPVSQAILERATRESQLAATLRDLRARGQLDLLQTALLVGRTSGAQNALLIRAIRLAWAPPSEAIATGNQQADGRKTPSSREPIDDRMAERIQPSLIPLVASADLVLVNTQNGDVLWTGRASQQTNDILFGPVGGEDDLMAAFGPGMSRTLTIGGHPAGDMVCPTLRGQACTRPISAESASRLIEATIGKIVAALNAAAK